MKNILAENMMRFGVKNLSESDVKRIEEVSLNETFNGTFEQAFPDYKNANVAFEKAFAAKQPNTTFAGKYHYYYTAGPNSDNTGYTVKIVGLGLRKCKDMTIVDFPTNGEEVTAVWERSKQLVSNTNWSDFLMPNRTFSIPPYEQNSAVDLAGGVNARFNHPNRPLATTQAMIALYPNIGAYIKKISADTTNPVWNAFKAKLTGNAKTLYGGSAV